MIKDISLLVIHSTSSIVLFYSTKRVIFSLSAVG